MRASLSITQAVFALPREASVGICRAGREQTRLLETAADDRIANMAAFIRHALALLEEGLRA